MGAHRPRYSVCHLGRHKRRHHVLVLVPAWRCCHLWSGLLHEAAQSRREPGLAMQIKITRSQRKGGIMGGKVIFMLDMRAEYSEQERETINKYNLGGEV